MCTLCEVASSGQYYADASGGARSVQCGSKGAKLLEMPLRGHVVQLVPCESA